MTLRLRLLRLMLAAACGFQFLAAGPVAHAQAAAAEQNDDVAPPALRKPAEDPPPTTEGWWAQTSAYYAIIFFVSGEPETAEQAKLCNCSRTNYSRLLGITPREEKAMREILQSPRPRLEEMNQEDYDARFGPDRVSSEQSAPLLLAHREEKERILKEVIAQLKQGFTDEDFKKLDAFVYEMSWEGRYAMDRRREQKELLLRPQPAANSDQGKQNNPSASNPAQAVPQP